MVDTSFIGRRLPTVDAVVEPGRLRGFRRVIGSADPSDPVAPPTFLFALEMLEAERPLAFIEDMDVHIPSVLHSEQSFDYHHPVRAGDRLVLETIVLDVFEKRGGALVFIVQGTRVTNDDGVHVADLRRTLVVRKAQEQS